jgi:hypothetical protein
MSDNKKKSADAPDAELLPPRELMSLIDPAGLPGTSGLPAAAPDPGQAAAPAQGIGAGALHQATTTPGTADPHVESTAKS